jgi:CTP:molybdopterin cytidylyltransferase MocA
VKLAGLLLAAGAGRRMGGPKAVLVVDGERLVDRGVRVLRAGGCRPVVVVQGAVDVGRPDGADVVTNPAWRTGLGSSLRAGLAALPADADAVVVTLVDQPDVSPEVVQRLAAAYAAAGFSDGLGAAVASYEGRGRNPVLLGRGVWSDAAREADGDVGARAFLRAHPEVAVEVPCDDLGSDMDLDTCDDLARWRRGATLGMPPRPGGRP